MVLERDGLKDWIRDWRRYLHIVIVSELLFCEIKAFHK